MDHWISRLNLYLRNNLIQVSTLVLGLITYCRGSRRTSCPCLCPFSCSLGLCQLAPLKEGKGPHRASTPASKPSTTTTTTYFSSIHLNKKNTRTVTELHLTDVSSFVKCLLVHSFQRLDHTGQVHQLTGQRYAVHTNNTMTAISYEPKKKSIAVNNCFTCKYLTTT